jgi:hypothetical protein
MKAQSPITACPIGWSANVFDQTQEQHPDALTISAAC